MEQWVAHTWDNIRGGTDIPRCREARLAALSHFFNAAVDHPGGGLRGQVRVVPFTGVREDAHKTMD